MSSPPVAKAGVVSVAGGVAGRRCADLRCIEAGFVDLRRLIHHGHGCIRNKTLSFWAPR